MSHILKQRNSPRSPRKEANSFCDSCENEGRIVPPNGFCLDCSKYFCAKCCSRHWNRFRDHVITEGQFIPSEVGRGKSKDQILVDRCANHADVFIEYFCQRCDQMMCKTCAETVHKKCKKVQFIPEIVRDDMESIFDIKNFWAEIEGIAADLHKERDHIESDEKTISSDDSAAFEAVTTQRKIVNTYVNLLEKNARTDVDDIVTENKKTLQKAKNEVHALFEMTRVMREHLEKCNGPRHVVQKFIYMRKSKDLLDDVKDRTNALRKAKTTTRYQFRPSLDVISLEEAVPSFGFISTTVPDQDRVARFIEDIKLDNSKWILGMTTVAGNRLLSICMAVCESEVMSKFVLIDPEARKEAATLDSDQKPKAIATICEIKAAATFPKEGVIRYIGVSKDGILTMDGEIKVGHGCSGLGYCRGRLVISYCDDANANKTGHVEIRDLAGTLLTSLINDDSGKPMFLEPKCLSVCPDQNLVFVADTGRRNVTKVTTDGKVVTVIANMVSTVDLALDASGALFVVDPNYVSHVSQSSKRAMCLTKALSFAHSLVISDSTMYVGTDYGVIKVYRLATDE